MVKKKSTTMMIVANGGLVSRVGVVENIILECFGINVCMDVHVVSLRGPSYSLVFGSPWMQELNVVEDWSKGHLTLPSQDVQIGYDMQLQQMIDKMWSHQWKVEV